MHRREIPRFVLRQSLLIYALAHHGIRLIRVKVRRRLLSDAQKLQSFRHLGGCSHDQLGCRSSSFRFWVDRSNQLGALSGAGLISLDSHHSILGFTKLSRCHKIGVKLCCEFGVFLPPSGQFGQRVFIKRIPESALKQLSPSHLPRP